MFKRKKTRVLFTPPVAVEEPVVTLEEPQFEEVVGINSAEVESRYKEFVLGVVIDYNNTEYDFEWDSKNFRLAKLSGVKVSPTTWDLASSFLTKFFTPKPAPRPVVKEPPVTIPVIEEIVEKVVAPIEKKFETAPVVEELDLSDDDLAIRARQVLQQIGTNPLDVEYMEL